MTENEIKKFSTANQVYNAIIRNEIKDAVILNETMTTSNENLCVCGHKDFIHFDGKGKPYRSTACRICKSCKKFTPQSQSEMEVTSQTELGENPSTQTHEIPYGYSYPELDTQTTKKTLSFPHTLNQEKIPTEETLSDKIILMKELTLSPKMLVVEDVKLAVQKIFEKIEFNKKEQKRAINDDYTKGFVQACKENLEIIKKRMGKEITND